MLKIIKSIEFIAKTNKGKMGIIDDSKISDSKKKL